MNGNMFFGGNEIILNLKKEATESQIAVLKKMYPYAKILIEQNSFVFNEKEKENLLEGNNITSYSNTFNICNIHNDLDYMRMVA